MVCRNKKIKQRGDGMNADFKRILGRRDVLALAFGAMIGWSWVAVAGDWISRGGSLGAILAFVGGGLAITLIGLTYAELAAAMPKAGGEHVYTKRALGRGWSFICTWAIIFAYVGVAAFESIAVAMIAEYFFPAVKSGFLWTIAGHDVYAGSVAIGMGATLIITLLNIMGVKQAAIFQLIATVMIVLGGVVLVTGSAINGSTANFAPLFTTGFAGVAGVLVMVPSMMVGFDVIPQSAEEIDLPFKDIGKVLMLALGMAVLWYVFIIIGVSLALDEGERMASTLTTAAASKKMWAHPMAGHLLVIAGLGGVLTSWNAFVIGGSRAIYALSRAGQLPAVFGKLHPTARTPWAAITLIGFICLLSPLLGRQSLVWIIDASGLMIVTTYGLVAASFLILRKREPDMERPYRAPYGTFVGWASVLLSIALATLYLPGSPAALIWPHEWALILGWILFGAILFGLAKTNKTQGV